MPQIEPMPIEERYPYLRRMQPRYRKASRQAKSRLLDEMMTHTGLHRKSLIRLLNSDLRRQPRQRERGVTYKADVDAALRLIWEALDYVCPRRLTPQLLPTVEQLAASWRTLPAAQPTGTVSDHQYLHRPAASPAAAPGGTPPPARAPRTAINDR
jgi:hypothetical protein